MKYQPGQHFTPSLLYDKNFFFENMENSITPPPFCKKMNFLPYLAWNSKNQQKFAKMRKRNILLDV